MIDRRTRLLATGASHGIDVGVGELVDYVLDEVRRVIVPEIFSEINRERAEAVATGRPT
jgi:hypothetical protein